MLKKIYNWSSSWTGTIVIVLTIIFFVAQAFVIPSGSMKNTLLIGDMLFVKKFAYGVPTPTIPWIEVKVKLHGITGMLIAVVLLLTILAVLVFNGVLVQQREASNAYQINQDLNALKANSPDNYKHYQLIGNGK